jgi:DNA polymerase III delta prime subunit
MWVDKYRPTTLEKLDVHPSLNERLMSIGRSGDLPHLLFTGPSGAGKKSRIMALLRSLFGASVLKVCCTIIEQPYRVQAMMHHTTWNIDWVDATQLI